jgi:site-specific DNA-cytosine methylase|nr:MAG TPA: cytosine DNA methyltransferase [Caudoviricetes sp.]
MAERPLYTLYKNLKAQNYDVPDDYNKFESALTRDGKGGADNRHAIYENLKAQNFDVPSTYERFYSALFEPRSKTSSRAKGGSVPMSAADRARFSAGAAAISASARQTMNNAGRYNILKQRKQKQQKDFGRVNLGTHQTPYGGDANNVVKDDFAYNPETGKIGAYVTSDNENVYSLPEAEQMQAILDKQNDAYQVAVDTGEIPSAFDVRDKNGNYDLQENIGKNGTYLTEEGAQKQFDKKLADAYARKKEIEALIAEDNRQHGNPLLSYGASIGAGNGRTAEQSDYRNKLATSLSLVTEQIGALEAVKQYPTSSWGEDALKALDNTAFTAKTWDFGLTDFAIMGQMERIKTKMDNNIPLSGSDKMLLKSKLGADAATALEDDKMGNVYRWTKIAGQSLPFMADFFLTGGYGGITKGISRGALKFAAKRGMGKVSAAILKNTGIVAGDVIGSYAMAGTEQALKTGADIMQRHLGNLYQDEKGDYKFGTFDENGNLLHEGGESIGTALYKGMTSAMVENYTEKLFGHNYGIKKGAVNFMEKHGMNASAEFFKNIGKSGWYTNSKKWMEKFGINGFAEEVMEEEIGIPLHALLDGEGKVSDILDARQQLDIIGGMAISVGSMYAMGAGSRPVKGIYNRAQYYRFRNKVNVADIDAQNLMGDNWADIKDKIDNATNEQMGGVLADILRQRDTMTKEQINAAVNYGINLMKMRGYNIAKTAEMNAKEITNEPTTPEEQHQADIDNAYSEGHDADDADKHDIQIQQEDQMKTLAAALGISEQQLSAMSDEELESMTGQDDKLDQAIYDYQLSSARYQGVVDDAQDKVDLAAHQAEQRVDMYTDQSRGSVRNATIKASGGLEDYGVYIISGNIATHDDGSIDVGNSDDMILYFDPTTNSVEHADALMFAELGEELPADDVKAQAVAYAKENAIKEVAGIIDGTVEVGSQFNVTDTDGTEHTYEVLADYGDGTAAISIDGNVVENPYSLADLQQMKDLEDQKRLEAAKAEREQMEKEREAQQTQNIEETQPSFDFNQILNDNGNVVLADVLGKDGNTKYPNSQLFLIRDSGAKAKVMELTSDGSLIPHAVNKKDVRTATTMTLDEYKQAFAESSMIEDNSGENRGEIEVETPTIEGETAAPADETAAPESAETPATEQTPAAPAITLEDGTIVPMLEDGNPDFSKLTAAQTAELYDTQFGEDADSIVSGYVSDAKKALDKASNMTVKGKTFVEQKAAKDAKEKAIADAQAAYDSAIAIRDAYNERQLAKVEDTAEGRKELIEKARRKFARLKSAVKDDAEAVAQIYKETVGTLLYRLYDGTGIDVTDTIPFTAEEYVASNLGAHTLNYEGTETSKGVKQETGLSREDFAKTQLLAADGKGTTIDNLVHSLWENRPSNLDSLDTQDIRNAMLSIITSGFKASEARNYIENLRIAQAENILEEQKKAADNAAFAEENKAESEQQTETAPESEEKTGEENSDEENDEENEKINEQTNENINAPEVPEDATDDAPLGAQRDQTDLPFSARDNGTHQTTSERAADVEKNKVDDMKVVDNIVGEKTRKAFERLAKMMGADIQWQYSDKLGNGWIQETKDADGNVHRTIFITLDSSITEGAQFIFGHEMTHQIKNLNPAAYNELTQLVLDTYGSDVFDKAVDETMQRYSDAGFFGRARDYYAEEVVADAVGEMIRDLNLAHTLAMKMSHPLLAAIHEILQKIKLAFFGTEYSDVTKNIIRSIEQAYVKTAKGEVTNSETGEDVSFSLRQKPEPKKKGIGYKVFVLKDGKLYPPMVANPNGAATPVGVWLDADAAPIAGESKTGRPQVKQGGKGTQGGSGKLAYRPGWHLGVVPYAIQFNRKDADGNKTLFPKNFVFAEVEYAADVDYQEEARQEGINPSGKYQHSLAGLKHLPTDGYYMYRTNPNPETDPWVITGAMKVNRILTRAEQADLVSKAGREPQQIQDGDIVTDDVVNSINQEIADAPKFSLKTYHGTGANFDRFDTSHAYEGAGSETFGHGIYVTKSAKIGASYALKAKVKKIKTPKAFKAIKNGDNWFGRFIDNAVRSSFAKAKKETFNRMDELIKEDENIVNDETKPEWKQNAAQKELADFDKLKSLFEGLTEEDIPSLKRAKANRYEVEIPDDTGNNYLDWNKPMKKEQKKIVREGLEKLGVDVDRLVRNGYSLDKNFGDVYNGLLYYALNGTKFEERDSFVASSNFLSSLGFTGIKYYAGTIWGGAKKGDLNYVIFNEDDAKIVGNTKFSLKKVNDAFNQRLDELVKNPNQKDKILRLGRSSSFLKAGGIADADIELEFDKFVRKSGDKYKNNHPFNASDLKNLPMAIAEPIAVFKSTNANDHVVLTELQKDGKNFIVAIRAVEQHRKGGVVLEVNQITSLYPKEEKGIINWVNTGRISNVDKEKALHFIEALQPHAGTSITDEELKSAANIINSFETAKENGEKFSLKDEEYLKAVEDGDMEKAQKMVNEAAEKAGYTSGSDYQGTSAFNGSAPFGNGYFLTKEERKEAWENGDYDGDQTLGDYINRGIDAMNLDFIALDSRNYRSADPMRKEAIENVRNAIQKKSKTITMYRSVPADVKEDSFRNGDWVTPSRSYAVDNAKVHGWGDNYNIIEQKVPVDEIWWDGNDIAEWGYGREEDYINDTDFAYKNTKNNKKLLDAVTYDDNGNVIPLSQRFNEKNKDVRFSLKDEKTLAGVHNITEEKLRKALKLGGFANPSLAVIDTNKSGHDNFGEISFIAPSALLDKRTGNTGGTWITDAYTQRYPSVEREMSEKGYRKFEDWVDSLDYPSGAKAEIERQAKDALSDNNAPAWELMYLKEKGIDIKEYDSRIDYRWKEIISDHPTAEDILNSMKTDPELNDNVTSLAKHAIIHPTWEKVSLEVRRKMYKETGVKASPINPQVRKQTKEIFERDYAPTLLNKDGSPRKKDVKKVVEDIVKEHNDTKKYDFYLSKVKASNYVNKNGLYDDYIRWQENKLDEFGTKNRIFRGYKNDGTRKYVPETLENVSKAMREEADGQTNGSEYTSFGSFIAKLASRVDSTDEMRANKDKLSSNKDKEEFYEKWNGVYYDLAKFLYNDVFYGEQRLHDIVLQSDPKKYAKKEYGITLTPTFMKKLDALKNAVQTELKSAYFETKYNRPLRLSEFAAAVVPDNLGEDVRKGIENAGLPMYDYDPNKEGDRSRAFNEAINSSDNIRFSLAGERGAAAADKAEERTFRMDNLSVARKMEEENKDAKAIKMATGWERGADGKWRYEMPDAKIKDTMDVGGGHIVKRYEDDMLWNGGKLSKVIDAPELFKAYPQLKDVLIDTDAIMNDMPSNGEYNSKTNTITIHADELKYMNSILNHEIQHAIQDIEGFAKGGSPRLVRGEVKKRFDEVTKQIKQLRAEGKEDEAKALIEKNRGLYNAYQKNDDYNSYKSLAGEVEARNVQERMNMTPDERRKSLAESTEDVARKDQIFLGVGDVSFSLRDMADGKESGAADMAEDLKSLNTPDEVDDAIKTAIDDMPSGWKMANKKMIHIAQALGENRKAEIAGEEPKFSLKDGTLIKAGTYFSGGGLVEEGLKGIIDPVVAVEYDEKISGVYRNNFGQHIVTADVRDVDPRELVKQIDGEVEYFHASPVCKNYSQAKSNHAEVELDKETAASTAEFINAIKPKVVTIENVKGYKDSDAMKTITDALDANGYTWDADVYNAADYGGYTNRERLIVRAVRDGKLPDKPEKMAHKSGWYEAVADIIPTLTEKKNGVAPWMDTRLKADGIDWRNIDKPLYVMGSAYADGKIPHAFADELLPTLRTKSGDVIVMPDGKVYRAMGRVLARVSGVSDDYKMPFSENLSHTIIGNGIPTQLTEHVIAPLLTGSDPKFSIRTYHGTGASFDKFDFSHMGEGEGSQAFGWGGYVTNSKDIAEDYTRRAKIRKDNGGFEFVTDMSANNKDMVRQYIYKHKDVNKGLDAMRKDLSSALEMFPDDDDLKELSNILAKKNEEIAVPDNIAYLYDVDIPDDNGSNYLYWDAPLTDKQKNTIIKELRRLKIDFADFKKRGFSFDGSFGGNSYDFLMYALRRTKKWQDVNTSRAVSKFLSSIGFTGIKYKAGSIFGGAKEDDYNYVIFDENNANIVGNTRFSLRYDKFEHDLNQWKKDNNLPKDAQRPTIPQRNAGESAVDFLRRVDEYRKQMALWKTAPTYEQHLLSDDTALGEFNRELQRGSVLKRIAFQDSMLAIRKAQEAIMKEVGVDRLNMAEDAYTAENRSHGKGKNEFEEYNNEFLQPLRKAYHQMKKILGDSYDNVRIYMMAKHGLERDAQMAFKKSLDADFEDVAQRSAAYRAYKGDMNRITNDSDLEFGRVDFNTWRQRDNALRTKYSPSYMDYRYDENGIAYDYSGLSALFGGSDFEEAAHKLVRDIESSHVAEVQDLWNATNAATKKILRDGYKAGMMSKDTYQYVRDMYSHYIPLRGWDGTTADQVWDYVGGGKGAFNQTLKTAHGRTSIADDPIAYIENMAESGILLNNKNWVKQHLMLLAQNHPTSLLTLSKAWYVKSTDANGNEEWIPATPQITSQMNSNQVKAAIDAFEQKMEQMAQTGDATQQRDGLNIAYPQTHSEEREHEVRVMKDGEEYVIYVNGDPQLAQAMNNTRAHRVREIQSGKLDRAAAWLGRKMAAAYTSLSPLFIPSNYFRDLTMTLASTAIREDGRYNYLLRKNLATSWNLGFMLKDFQNGKLREKVSNGNATPKEQMFYDFMMNGGETGFVSSLDVEDLKKKFKNDLKDLDRWKANPVKVGHTIMDSIEFLNRMIEDSNRFAVYMTSIQYGRSIDEAVNDSKDVTLNFNRKGTGEYGWQMVRNLYLFINPAVQSLQTLGALAKHHPFKFTAVTASWLVSGVLVPIVNAALMSLLGGDDDKDKYWQFTKWDRRNNLIMWVPFTHEYVKIPLAQEFRAFYGVGDMIASKMMGGELAEESWSQYAEDLLGQVVDMLPLDPTGYDGNIAVSLMPNAIRPVFELAFNVDFTGKPLFKETEYNKYDPNFTKAYVGTPDWLVRVSRMMNSIGNDYPDVQQNSIDAFGDPRYNLNNPAVVDHVLSSYLGGAYTMGSQVLGVLTKSLNDPKEIKVADIPLFSKFVSNPDDRPVTKKQGDEFWDMKENHDRAANTLSKLKKQAKVDGDYSMLERFYGSEEYKQYKQDDVKVKKYEEDKKKERAEDSGEEYRPHKLNAEDIYKAHATPKDDFEDLKLKQLYTKLNGFKTSYDLLVDTAPSQSDGYYNNNKAAIDAIDEISLDKQEISELKKGFLDDGKDAYNAEDMKQIRDLRKKILSVLEKANKVVVANQKAKAKK